MSFWNKPPAPNAAQTAAIAPYGSGGGGTVTQTWTTGTNWPGVSTIYQPNLFDDMANQTFAPKENINAPRPKIKVPLVKYVSDDVYLSVLDHPDGSGDLVLAKFMLTKSPKLAGFGSPTVTFETRVWVDLEDGVPYFYGTDTAGKQVKATSLDGIIGMVFM